MAFIDEIKLSVRAGNGGDGVVRWHREKFKPMMGPGGGNGGRGADVYIQAVRDLAYLSFYQHKKIFKGENGGAGGSNRKEGKNGDNLILKVPMGSVVTNLSTKEVYELLEDGKQVILLKGGKGGLGNEHFKSSRNVSPYEFTKGKPGDAGEFLVELRLIADIGLVGLPNAGKSTLINALTKAKSKVAPYAFTTLEPHLGVIPSGHVMADIPGLIEGAAEGKGLGYKFLRHIARTKMILHLVSVENEEIGKVYKTIRNELKKYDAELLKKDEIILVTKADLVEEKELKKKITEIKKVAGKDTEIFSISSYDDATLKKLLKELSKLP